MCVCLHNIAETQKFVLLVGFSVPMESWQLDPYCLTGVQIAFSGFLNLFVYVGRVSFSPFVSN